MSGMLAPTQKPVAPIIPPPPQVDDAQARLNEQDRAAKRAGRKTTILTSENGLDNLGLTGKAGGYA